MALGEGKEGNEGVMDWKRRKMEKGWRARRLRRELETMPDAAEKE